MISLSQAGYIHDILIKTFGGSNGIRNVDLLQSALQRPYSTFEGKDLYNSPIKKAAALIESILNNHPFIDGNKRTGYVLMRLLLLEHGLDIEASQKDKYLFVIKLASGKINYNDAVFWLNNHIVNI
jgi:death-on-curing protein